MYGKLHKPSQKQKYQKTLQENYQRSLGNSKSQTKNNTVNGILNNFVNLNQQSKGKYSNYTNKNQFDRPLLEQPMHPYSKSSLSTNQLIQNNLNQSNNNRRQSKNIQNPKKQHVTMQQALGILNLMTTNQLQAFQDQNVSDLLEVNNNISRNILYGNNNMKGGAKKFSYGYNNNKKQNRMGLGEMQPTSDNANQMQENQNQLNDQVDQINKQNKQKDASSQLNRKGTIQLNIQQEQDNVNQAKKKLNQNRAIKRIIETAFGILQKNYRHTSNQSSTLSDELQEQKSTSTQFNIYMKQYNRIIQQINRKQTQKQEKINLLYENNQDELQEIFQYTVGEDFREKLEVMFSKQKVNKQNVETLVERFKEALVVLKPEGIKIEFMDSNKVNTDNSNSHFNHDTNRSINIGQPNIGSPGREQTSLGNGSGFKVFKMTQLQNVQYYTQPYIFICLSINKDKTKSKQYMYIKFKSEQNQDKWDRAIYCCYMSKKMSKKSKLFQIQFPVQDVMKKQKEEHKKDDQNYHIIPNEYNKVVEKCFSRKFEEEQRYILNGDYTKRGTANQDNMITERSEGMFNNVNKRNLTDDKVKIENDMGSSKKLNTVQNKGSKYQNPFKKQNMEDGNSNQANNIQDSFLRKNTSGSNKSKKLITGQNQQLQSGNGLSKKSTFNNEPLNSKSQSNASQPMQNQTSNINPFMRLLKIAQEQSQRQKKTEDMYNKPNKLNKIQNKIQNQQQKQQNNVISEQKIKKLKRLRQIKKNNIRGVICQKQRFFMNKQKILFLGDDAFNMLTERKQTDKNQQPLSIRKIQSVNKSPRQPAPSTVSKDNKKIQQMSQQQLHYHLSSQFIQYYDYDYKKDLKSERKVIMVVDVVRIQLLESVMGGATTSVEIFYLDRQGKEKQMRLMFVNLSTDNSTFSQGQSKISKAYQVYQWVMLLKEIMQDK